MKVTTLDTPAAIARRLELLASQIRSGRRKSPRLLIKAYPAGDMGPELEHFEVLCTPFLSIREMRAARRRRR